MAISANTSAVHPNFPGYEIRADGTVFSNKTNKLLQAHLTGQYPYAYVQLTYSGKSTNQPIHRLVLEAFVGPRPPGMECRHLNGIKTDNRLTNLAWGTHDENMQDAVQHAHLPRGEELPSAKLTENEVIQICCLSEVNHRTQASLADQFHVSTACINRIIRGRSWAWLTGRG